MLSLLTANELLKESPPLAIDGAVVPRRLREEPGHTTQIPLCLRLTPHLGDGLLSITQDDAVHNREKVSHLRLRETELQKQNEVDDIRIAGYHRLGQSFLRLIGRRNRNFDEKMDCPI